MNLRKPTSPLPQPTDAELEILQVLWQQGPVTVRQVHETLASEKDTGYTTTLKLLQKMAEKGLVMRDRSERSHVYRAAAPQEKTQSQLVRHLLRKAFADSPGKLVMQALSEQPVSASELAEIRQLLDKIDKKKIKRGLK